MSISTEFYDTERWAVTIGTNSGYELSAQLRMPEEEAAELYRAAAEQVYAETGVYVSAVLHPARSLYRAEWGCPPGGEFVCVFSGCRNPRFAEREPYLAALRRLTALLKERLGQSAVYLELWPARCEYFAP